MEIPKKPRRERPSKEVLYDLYIVQNKQVTQVAKELGLGEGFVRNTLSEYGIKKVRV